MGYNMVKAPKRPNGFRRLDKFFLEGHELFMASAADTPLSRRRLWTPDGIAEEGVLREALAAWFLSSPPPDKLTPSQKKRQLRALRRLAELECLAAVQTGAARRVLRYGDVSALLRETMDAAVRKLEPSGARLELFLPERPVCMAAEPRLIQMAVIRAVRACLASGEGARVAVRMQPRAHSVAVTVGGTRAPREPLALAMMKTAARAHRGSIALAEGSAGFSLSPALSGAVGLFAASTADELLRDSLSPVNVGLA